MKLRIRGDSIRLRLVRAEVQALADGGRVCELVHFPDDAVFRYELRSEAAVAAPAVSFSGGLLALSVPERVLREWARSEEVAIRAQLPIRDGQLTLLIEKDFPCLEERPFEDDRGAFPRDRLSLED
jgi:hypothetical protein